MKNSPKKPLPHSPCSLLSANEPGIILTTKIYSFDEFVEWGINQKLADLGYNTSFFPETIPDVFPCLYQLVGTKLNIETNRYTYWRSTYRLDED